MKAIILTTAILLGIIPGINKSAYATTADSEKVSTTLAEVSKVNKIEVYGNVQVLVSNGETDKVKVYNRYYKESALIQNQNGTLRIASYKAEKLVVWVTAADLRSIEVHDNAEVKSFGKFAAIDLDVKLYDKAIARLDVDAFEANVTLNDNARAYLAGNIAKGQLKCETLTFLNTANLASTNQVKTIIANGNEKIADDLVSL